MNALAIIVSVLSLLGHVGLAFFFYGRLTQKVSGQGKKLDETAAIVTQHHGEIGELFGHAGIPR